LTEEKRIIFINVRKNFNKFYLAFLHTGGKSRAHHLRGGPPGVGPDAGFCYDPGVRG
jgi:hypothetical protein